MQKFFVKSEQIQDHKIEIQGEDVNHISNVLRMKKEEQILIGNKENGKSYLVKIEKFEKEKILCEIIKQQEQTTEPSIKITLFQGVPKIDKMEWIIEKTTEIGISAIVPVVMQRCVTKVKKEEEEKKRQRWQKIAEGAAKQSKRDKIPKIERICKFQEIIEKIPQFDLFLIAYEEEKQLSLKQILRQTNNLQNIAILVGPEGGIENNEIKKLEQTEAKRITLGNRILRTETAPIVLTSNLLYELEG